MAFGDSIFIVTNEDNKPLDFIFNRQSITILPGRKAMVPLEALVSKLGDPLSGPTTQNRMVDGTRVGTIAPRHWWLKRLAVTYGTYDETNIELLKSVMPKVTITTLEGDDPGFSWPVEDPDCLFLKPSQPGMGTSTEEQLRREIEDQKRRLKALEMLVKNANIPEPTADIPEDTPPATMRQGQGKPPIDPTLRSQADKLRTR